MKRLVFLRRNDKPRYRFIIRRDYKSEPEGDENPKQTEAPEYTWAHTFWGVVLFGLAVMFFIRVCG